MNQLIPPVGRSDIVVQSLQKNHRYILSNLHSSLTTIIPRKWLTLEMPRPLKKQKETSASEETKGSIKRSSCSSNNNDPRWQHLLRLQLNLTITNNQPKHHHHHQQQQQSTKTKTNLDNLHRPSSFFNYNNNTVTTKTKTTWSWKRTLDDKKYHNHHRNEKEETEMWCKISIVW